MNFALYGIRYTVCKMNGKRVENSIEIRAYIKARSVFSLMPVDIHLEMCDIYEGGGGGGGNKRPIGLFAGGYQS